MTAQSSAVAALRSAVRELAAGHADQPTTDPGGTP